MVEIVLRKINYFENFIENWIEKSEQFDDWLDGNWIVFIIVVLMFCYEFYVNFDKWMVL